MFNTHIYSLSDPKTGQPRYIGKTNNIKTRLCRHINESKTSTKSHKKAWVNSLIKEGLEPTLEIIDTVGHDWGFWEIYYISLYKSWGFKLTNSTNGGEGGSAIGRICSDETKLKISKSNMGKTQSEESRKKMSEFRTGTKLSKETKQRMSKSRMGRECTEETRKLISLKNQISYKVIQLDLNGEIIKIWESHHDAAIFYDCVPELITRVCYGNRITYKKYKWKFL